MCGKYNSLHDAYKSILEAFIHAGVENVAKVNVKWIDTEKLEKKKGYRQQRVAKKKKTSRKGASPYNKFVAKQSPIIRAANPGKAQPEIMKLIAKAWADEKKK